MSANAWVPIILAAHVPKKSNLYVEVEGLRLLVHHVEDEQGEQFFVTSSQCPHEDFTMEHCVLTGRIITCIEHGWKMRVDTGKIVAVGDDEDAMLPVFDAEVRSDGFVWAKLF